MKSARLSLFAFLAALLAVWGIKGSGQRQSSAQMNPTNQAEGKTIQGKRVPVTVELFTSEGCSSCPPADALLARLVREQPIPGAQIIALGEHVDYWNRRGWKDIYSSAVFSARQAEYVQSLGSESVYTPQLVVDGRVEFVGSDERRARETIVAATQTPKLSIRLTRRENRSGGELARIPLWIHVEGVPATGVAKGAEVLLAITEDDLQSNVTRGENAGRRLRHVAVVRRLRSLGKLKGRPNEKFTAEPVVIVPEGWTRQNLHAVVLVQGKKSRRVLGAATMDLGSQ